MGLGKPILSAAFGNKEALYVVCLNRYVDWGEQGLRSAILENEALLLRRLLRAKKEKQLPANANVEGFAIFFSATITRLSVMAKTGAGLEKTTM